MPQRWRLGHRTQAAVALGGALSLLIALAPAATALPGTSGGFHRSRPAVQTVKSVPGVVRHVTATTRAARATVAVGGAVPAITWPAAATASGSAARGRTQLLPGTPLTLKAPTNTGSGQVVVTLAAHQLSERLGVPGPIVTVTGSPSTGTSLSLDYGSWAAALGGDGASRLRVVTVPNCATRTPASADCASATLLPSTNDRATHTLTFPLQAYAAESGAGAATSSPTAPTATSNTVTYAVTASPSGPNGNYAATSLSASARWNGGSQTGDFTWSYPLPVPPGLNGPDPQLAINYSSGSVDGRTQSTNNQTSWVGEGHSLEPGYVERKYVACADDMPGGNNATRKTGDLCWRSDNATLVLNGHATELIKDAKTGSWRLREDDGSTVQRLTGGSNADNDHEYWSVTTQDGTRYVFGEGLRGTSDTGPNSNATWTVPVAGNQPGEPCYASTFGASFCTQAWRWNLDYVVDAHGNSTSYYYAPETNNYGRNNGSAKVSYVRGGYLSRIEYGERAGSEWTTSAPAEVTFDTLERCIPTAALDCQPSSLTSTTSASWPDVPFDQICADGANACTGQFSPSFFTRRRLTSITTQILTGSTYAPVDNWTLTQSFPDPGDGSKASLWLSRITHTGVNGGSGGLPDVTFDMTGLQNRVDGGLDGAPPLMKYRVTGIHLDTGGSIAIAYSQPECVYGSNMPASEDTDDKRCFPAFFFPEGATAPTLSYFHKYRVETVTEDGNVDNGVTNGGITIPGVLKTTTYRYQGAPAWHYDDNELVQAKYRTWSDWRGYTSVQTITGTTGAQTLQQDTYMRGMDGDQLLDHSATTRTLSTTRRTASVLDSQGGTLTDSDQLRGYLRETQTFNGPGGTEISGTINTPWVSAANANDGNHTAVMVRTAVADGRRTLSNSNSTLQRSQVTTSYDGYGMPITVDDAGDLALTTDDLCTRTEYARNPAINLVDDVSRTETVAVRCAATPNRPSDVVADTRTYYDNSTTLGAAPTQGDPTRTERLADWPAGGPVYKQASRASFDDYGRILDSYDALDRKTSTGYVPATGGPLTGTTTTNPLGYTTTRTLDPGRGDTLIETDANNKKTELAYDPLGRLTNVWLPDRPRATASPNIKYEYLVRTDGPIAVTTDSLEADGSYSQTITLYDGLLRQRQTQTQAPIETQSGDTTAGRVITDTKYDARGLPTVQNAPFYNSAAVSTDLFDAADNVVPGQTVTTYDGDSRVTRAQFRSSGTNKWATVTTYGGDRVTVTPPQGGTATTTVSDLRGRTIELDQYKNGPGSGLDATLYSYTPADKLSAVTDPAGNTWTYTYDLRGRQVASTDPDRGASSITYDDADEPTLSTDARGQTLWTTYDDLGRRTELRKDSSTGALRASWTYDTLAKGQLTASTRYSSGNAYTSTITGYDSLYRPAGNTTTIPTAEGAFAGSYTSTISYRADGTINRLFMPAAGDLAAEPLSYSYDELGELKTIIGAATYRNDTWYDPFGHVVQAAAGSTVASTQSFWYDPATQRLTRAKLDRLSVPNPDADLNYSYDPAGNLTQVTDAPQGGTTDNQCFAYDYLRRLTDAWTPTGSCATSPSTAGLGGPAPYWQSYTYDLTGNRKTRTDHAATGDTTAAYTYPAAGQIRPHTVTKVVTTAPGGATTTDTFGYNLEGDTNARTLAGQPGQTLAWDPEGKLQSVTSTAGTTSYLYDADGGRLIRRDPTGTTLYLDGQELRLANTAGATPKGTRFYTAGGSTFASRQNGVVSTLFNDPHGTAEFSVGLSTNAVSRRRSGPFGDPRGAQPGSWPNERGFVDGTQDPTGLVQLGARAYDSARGRFISPDPVVHAGDPQSLNGYAYAKNNPTTWSDPTGLNVPREPGDGGAPGEGGGAHLAPTPTTHHAGSTPDNGGPSNPRQADHHDEIVKSYYPAPHQSAGSGRAPNSNRGNEATSGGWGMVILHVLSQASGVHDTVNCLGHGQVSGCLMGGLMVGSYFTGFGELRLAGEVAVEGVETARGVGAAEDGAAFFRGAKAGEAPSFTPRPNEYKVDPGSGFVRETHGVSVFDNPESVASKGFTPHQLDPESVPDELRVIQRGNDPHHYEIVPRPGANLTPEQFISCLSQIVCN